MEEEVWRDIKGYEGLYQVSDLGRVKSFQRNGRILKTYIRNKYLNLGICRGGIMKKYQVHQLVAIEFLGHIPNGLTLVVDHVNGNKLDNRASNLRIVTHRDNTTTCFRQNNNSLSSKYTGVSWDKVTGRWRASIEIKSKNIFLGRFNEEIDAYHAYQKALKLYV